MENNSLKNLVNIITVLAATSFYFYFIGVVSKVTYFGFLKIPFDVSIYSYQYYVLQGVMMFILAVIIFIPLAAIIIFCVKQVRISISSSKSFRLECIKNRREALGITEVLPQNEQKKLDLLDTIEKHQNEVEVYLERLEILEGKLINDLFPVMRKLITGISILYIVVFLLELYLLKRFDGMLIISLISLAVGYYMYLLVGSFLKKPDMANWSKIIYKSYFVIILFTFVLPATHGIVNAISDKANDEFRKVSIFVKDIKHEAVYFFEDVDSYMLKINDKIMSVPKKEVGEVIWHVPKR